MRYDHPIWNSSAMNFIAAKLVYLNNWIWVKQYGKQ